MNEMKNPVIVWSVAGVAIALVAIFAMRSNSSTTSGLSATPASSSPVTSADMTSQVNTYNNNAAAVEQSIVAANESMYNMDSTNRASVINVSQQMASNNIATVEGAASDRYATQSNNAASEYATHANAITSQYESYNSTITNASDNAAASNIANYNANAAVQIAGFNASSADVAAAAQNKLDTLNSNNALAAQYSSDQAATDQNLVANLAAVQQTRDIGTAAIETEKQSHGSGWSQFLSALTGPLAAASKF